MPTIDESIVQSVLSTLQDGRLFRYECDGPEDSITAQLEREFARKIGVRHAVAMNSCSSALYVALLAAGVRPADRVLVPAFTFTAVPSAIVHAGAQPVLVEMTPDYVLDCDDLEDKIDADTRFLLLSYMRGRVPNLDRVLAICSRHAITVIEDCAHSLGVLWRGRQTGTFGKVAAFSAQSYKIIDAGEGGLLVTDDDELALKCILYSGAYEANWEKHFGGWDDLETRPLVNVLPAFNFRMSNLTAAVLLPQLAGVERRVDRYNWLYSRIMTVLGASPHISLPKYLPHVRPAADSIQFQLTRLSLSQTDAFLRRIADSGVRLTVLGRDALNARCFWNWRYFERREECPRTRSLLQSTVDMRLNADWSKREADQIAEAIVAACDDVVVSPASAVFV